MEKKSKTKRPGVRDEARVLGKGHTMKFQMHYIKDLGCYLKSKRKPVMLAVQLKT